MNSPQKQGILLVNLGSPDTPTEPDVRNYLREFLMDERVTDLPRILRRFLVNYWIIPARTARTARACRAVWWLDGSPLVVIGRSLAAKLEAATGLPVAVAMRYRRPSVALALRRLYAEGVRNLTVLPLFPQFATATYESAVLHVDREIQAFNPTLKRRFIPPYYAQPEYLDALATTARPFISHEFDHLLFSFHGLPERHLRKSDPTGSHCLGSPQCCEILSPARQTCYRAQCIATALGVSQRLDIPHDQWSLSFQSRVGRAPWMLPCTEDALKELGARGIKRLVVMCPGFAADCVETLEEVAIRGRETFLAAGGESFGYVPCLNDHPFWVEALHSIIVHHITQPYTEDPIRDPYATSHHLV